MILANRKTSPIVFFSYLSSLLSSVYYDRLLRWEYCKINYVTIIY
ncbi:hypothetical protein SPAR22_2313 [Streptococcus pneumoniae GA11304]|nr:hypothetical protein SPAR22_2313 [Streptococcus pneumoniae GA11304]